MMMSKDFSRWFREQGVCADTLSEEHASGVPSLMRPLEELEAELAERCRNLYPCHDHIPRGSTWVEEVAQILDSVVLSPEYADSPVWRGAHQLHWQVKAMKGDPRSIMWHPV